MRLIVELYYIFILFLIIFYLHYCIDVCVDYLQTVRIYIQTLRQLYRLRLLVF